MLAEWMRVVGAGLSLGLQFNPVSALLGAGSAAAFLGSPDARARHSGWAAALLAIAFVLGDGLRLVARTRDIYDGVGTMLAASSPAGQQYAAIAIWAVAGLCVGYLAPLWAGTFAGRRVLHGAGRIAAAGVAGGMVLTLATLVSGL